MRSRLVAFALLVTGTAVALAAAERSTLPDENGPWTRYGPARREPAPYARAKPTAFPAGFRRGVCYPSPTTPELAFGTPGCREALAKIKAAGADTVALCPYFTITRTNPYALGKYTGAADRAAVQKTILWARELGLAVVLRPQLVTHVSPPHFHLKIRHREDWQEVFGVLDVLLRDAAELAEETHCAALSLGTRLEEALDRAPQNWPILIARVREVYHGLLTYDADWRREVDRVPFWDLLDVISITFYPRMGEVDEDDPRPTDLQLVAHAQKPSERLSDLWYRHHKPVWFSEVGIAPNALGALHPFQRPLLKAPPDNATQARALATEMLAYQDKRWLSGMMVWAFDTTRGPAWNEINLWFAPGPARDEGYRDRKDLIGWIDDCY